MQDTYRIAPSHVPALKSRDFGIGYIGCGTIAGAHAKAAQELKLPLVACADVVPQAAEAFARKFNIPHWYDDYRRLLERPDVAVVEVAVPPAGRVEIVTAAAQAGKHVHIEKPLAHSFEEAAEMVRVCREAGVKLAVSQNTRYFPGAWAVTEILKSHAIGDPFAMQLSMFGRQDRTNTKWYRTVDHFLLIEWGSHHFDILRQWAGRPPERVCCLSRQVPGQNFESDMLQMSLVDFGGPLAASLLVTDACASDAGHHPGDGYPVRIEGSRGVLRGYTRGPLEICTDEDRTRWRPVDLSPFTRNPIGCLLSDFLSAIETGSEPPHSGQDNLLTVASYMAAVRSKDESNRWVRLDEVLGSLELRSVPA